MNECGHQVIMRLLSWACLGRIAWEGDDFFPTSKMRRVVVTEGRHCRLGCVTSACVELVWDQRDRVSDWVVSGCLPVADGCDRLRMCSFGRIGRSHRGCDGCQDEMPHEVKLSVPLSYRSDLTLRFPDCVWCPHLSPTCRHRRLGS